MSNLIWYTRDEEPKKYPILALGDDCKYYVFESPRLGTGDLGWQHRCHDYIKQYCYIDDLIAKANKVEQLEKEIEAMREEFEVWHGNHKCTLKDLEIAQNALKKITNADDDDVYDSWCATAMRRIASMAIEQIKNNNNFNNYS